MARFCPNCGMESPEDAVFCPACGGRKMPLTEPVVASTIPEAQNIEEPSLVQQMPYEEPSTVQQIPIEEASTVQQIPNEDPVVPDPDPVPQDPPKKKKPLWLIPIAAVLALIVAAAFLWKPIMLKFAPDTYLSWAYGRTAKALAKRSEGSPADLLDIAQECLNNGSVTADVKYSDGYGDEVSVLVDLKSNSENKQWSLDAQVGVDGDNYDVALYMDEDFMSLGSSLINDGQHYGVAYDSVEQDLRNSPFGDNMTDEEIDEVVDVFDMLKEQIDRYGEEDDQMKPYKEIIQSFIDDQELQVGKDSTEVGGKQVKCDTITITIEHEELIDLLWELADELENDDNLLPDDSEDVIAYINEIISELDKSVEVDIEITYYVYRNKVYALAAVIDMTDNESGSEMALDLEVHYGKDIEKDDIVIDAKMVVDGDRIKANIVSSVDKEDDTYSSTNKITCTASGEKLELELTSKWNRKNGRMKLEIACKVDDEEFNGDIAFDLKETEDGFTLEIKDLYQMLCDIDPDFEDENDPFDCSIALSFSKESKILKPAYTNISDITDDELKEMADFIDSLDDGTEDHDDDDLYGDFDFGVTPKFVDDEELLSEYDATTLEDEIKYIVWMNEVDVVIVTAETTNGDGARDYSDNYFLNNGYGLGEDRSGIILAVSMDEREWGITTYGECTDAMPDTKLNEIMNEVAPLLTSEDYYDAFSLYLEQIDQAMSDYWWSDYTGEEIATPW